ncbi:potassium/proton antiporter [Roseateles asaccharophilus]|uniref:Cell volume regulation protein A n=1 Tax=Roseateles asaccharophilus TaxID=582607 RepID=A0ABU2AA83_9BURK|nr:potassium/proton antiporter [Roseateles asaccharophilus]MDR7334117.1 cell volume regulation protein A [Roseateles asaccharophilus]
MSHGGGADILTAVAAALVLAAIVGALYTHRFGLSHLVVFMGVGMLAGVDGPLGLRFENYGAAVLVGNLALVLILFDGGLRTRWNFLRIGMAPAALLATLGVLVTAGVVAGAARLLLGVPWLQGLLLGAAVSSTDASAVFAQFNASKLALPHRLAATIEVESAVNDPMAIVLTVGLITWMKAGGGSDEVEGLQILVPLLLRQLGLGLVMGVAAGLIAAACVKRLPLQDDHDGLAALLMAAFGLLLFGLTNTLGGSGFLAAYIAGVFMRHHADREAQLALPGLNGYTWLAEAGLFLLLGLLVTPHEVLQFVVPGLGVAAALMLVARPLGIAACLAPLRFGWREQAFVAWSGLRGGWPIVLAAYPVLAGVPGAWQLFDVAFLVVLLSLLIQGPTLAPLARALRLDRKV